MQALDNSVIKEFEDFYQEKIVVDRPVIPGVFDLVIPPGTPRKLIINLSKEHNVEVVQRNDIYIPIGVSDIQRELLAFRGSRETIGKMEKILLKELEKLAA